MPQIAQYIQSFPGSVIIDLVQEYTQPALIQEPTTFSDDDIKWVANHWTHYAMFDKIANKKQRDRLERAFDGINLSLSIIDSRLRIMNYWMSVETLLKYGGALTEKMKQAIPLIENCSKYYFCNQEGIILNESVIPKLKEGRFERQEEIKKLYQDRGKIAHGQFESPFEHQGDSHQWEKYYQEMLDIENRTMKILSNLICGILSLGKIPTHDEIGKGLIDGYLKRKNHEKYKQESTRL